MNTYKIETAVLAAAARPVPGLRNCKVFRHVGSVYKGFQACVEAQCSVLLMEVLSELDKSLLTFSLKQRP